MKTGERFAGGLVKLTVYTVAFGASLAEFAVLLVAFFYAWFTLLCLGLFLVIARAAFLESIPWLIDAAVPIVDLVSRFLITFGLVEDTIILIIDAVISVIDFFGGHIHGAAAAFFTQITYNQYRTTLRTIATSCVDIDSTYAIAKQWVPRAISPGLCPCSVPGCLPGKHLADAVQTAERLCCRPHTRSVG